MLGEAMRRLRQVIDWRPDNPIPHSNLGLVHYFKGESEPAVIQWREVTRLSPRSHRADAKRLNSRPMTIRRWPSALNVRKRSSHYPLKVAAFRHSFHSPSTRVTTGWSFPGPTSAAAARWQQRARRARQRMSRA